MPEQPVARPDSRETVSLYLVGVVLLVVLPLLNVLTPEDSWLHLSDFRLNQFGKFLCLSLIHI